MRYWFFSLIVLLLSSNSTSAEDRAGTDFFESRIRPLLVKNCYECHSEQEETREGNLLLDRSSGWLTGGDSGKAVVPGNPEASLLIETVRYSSETQMPPDGKLSDRDINLLVEWIRRGAPGPKDDPGETEFSKLGDQDHLFSVAEQHWAFEPVKFVDPPEVANPRWNRTPVDRFVFASLRDQGLTPSAPASAETLVRRLSFDLTGLPPSPATVESFLAASRLNRETALDSLINELISSPAYGQHIARLWLDVARYADTDSFYRPDTRTPHYFPFAFTYRDYVVESFHTDKPYDQFIREQLAADLIEPELPVEQLAALGFLAVGPYANRDQQESLDDWIDATTRGLMGMTVACARCHDHKYEPVPTADYYSLRGVFASTQRIHPLDEKRLPEHPGYKPDPDDLADYLQKRAKIDEKINGAGDKKKKKNNKSDAKKIRETELAKLLLFHHGAPAHVMTVIDKNRPVTQPIYIRGEPKNAGPVVPRRFLKVLDPDQKPFPEDTSGRLQLAEKIVDPDNPLTARVFVNRVWGYLMGSHLVETPSDFGLQGATPSHPELLDWLAGKFVENSWSTRWLVRMIVSSETYQQRSLFREDMVSIDPENRFLWRANRKHLSIEAIRDSLLKISGELDPSFGGRAEPLWGGEATHRRSLYGYINRFNLDPTLRAFDFPTPMQSQPAREESIAAPQALFTLNSPFVIDRAAAIAAHESIQSSKDDREKIDRLFKLIYQRPPIDLEVAQCMKLIERQSKFKAGKRTVPAWSVLVQALLMSNEFQYID